MRHSRFGWTAAIIAVFTSVAVMQAAAETREVANGLQVHETALILQTTPPTHMLTSESCANAQSGWQIVPDSVKTEVPTARMMDPGGDPDWKVEKAEGRIRIERDNTRICLWGYCQGPLQFQCEIEVRASWQETR